MEKKQWIIAGVIILLSLPIKKIYAQDPHFSQYFTSPMTMNPALTGKDVGGWRATSNFRSQWWGGSISPFTTITAGIEKGSAGDSLGKNSFGLGLFFLSDQSNAGILKNNYLTAGVAYHISLNATGSEQLSLGIEAGYANRLLDASKFEFQSQFGSMGFQRSTASGDPVNVQSNQYFDINAGVDFSNNKTSWGYGLGAAIFHASNPKQGVYNNSSYSLSPRLTFRGSLFFKPGNNDEWHFSGINDVQGENSILTLGSIYKIGVHQKVLESLNIGIFNRFHDALYPYIGMEAKSWLLGLSYDIVTSDIRTAYNSVQSMEVSFTWLFGSGKTADEPKQVVHY